MALAITVGLIMSVLLVAFLVFPACLPPSRQLNVGNFVQVRPGMTQNEVEVLLGGLPGFYGRNFGQSRMTEEGVILPPGVREMSWSDDNNRLEVFFGSDGKVWGSHKRAGFHVAPISFKEKLRQLMRRLGL